MTKNPHTITFLSPLEPFFGWGEAPVKGPDDEGGGVYFTLDRRLPLPRTLFNGCKESFLLSQQRLSILTTYFRIKGNLSTFDRISYF